LSERSIGGKTKFLAATLTGALALGLVSPAYGAPPAPAAPAASAKPDLFAAKKAYAEGEKKFKAGDFPGALADFVAANDVKATPQAERYIGLCHDALGHMQEAASFYERFLEHVPEKLTAQGDETRKRLSDIRALPGKVHVESNPPGAAVIVDGKPLTTVTPTDTDLLPGAHAIKLTESGRLPTERQIDVAFASTQTVSVELDAEPPPPPPAPPPTPAPVAEAPPPSATPLPPPPEPRSRVPAYVTGGLAIAAAGVGTVFGIIALSDKSDFDKNPTTNTADNGDTHALIADMAFGVALTFGVTSAVLFLSKDEPPPASVAEKTGRADAESSAEERDAKRASAERARRASALSMTPTPWVGRSSAGAGFLLRF
jgi:hypothetical protein